MEAPLPPARQGHWKRQENRAVIAGRKAASVGLVSSADRAYMKAPVPRLTLRPVDKMSRGRSHIFEKVANRQDGYSLRFAARDIFLPKLKWAGKSF